jgi:hypothetical protein
MKNINQEDFVYNCNKYFTLGFVHLHVPVPEETE